MRASFALGLVIGSALLASFVLAPIQASAQVSLLPSAGWGVGPTVSAWHFDKPMPQASGAVSDVAEAAFPLRLRVTRRNWTTDLSGAVAYGATLTKTDDDDGRLLSIGASGERRSEYSPVTLALVNGTSETRLTPGMAGRRRRASWCMAPMAHSTRAHCEPRG